jgi:hypothetical protein
VPKAKRAPINYTPQFGGAIFRPKDVVEGELAALELDEESPSPSEIQAHSPAASEDSQGQAPMPGRSRRPAPRGSVKQDGTLASNQASTFASYPSELIEQIRKSVKVAGREVSFVRLTPEEKGLLADLVYTYKRQGRRTTENEISRIAINLLLQDHKNNGNASVLARVIDALLA